MGYSTYFTGSFKLNKPANAETRKILKDILEDSENVPGGDAPGFYCQWSLNDDGTEIEHDGGEKFYNYIEWAEWIHKWLIGRGYEMTGNVQWSGEEGGDIGTIVATKEKIIVIHGELTEHEISSKDVIQRLTEALKVAKMNFENGYGMPSLLLEAIELAEKHKN